MSYFTAGHNNGDHRQQILINDEGEEEEEEEEEGEETEEEKKKKDDNDEEGITKGRGSRAPEGSDIIVIVDDDVENGVERFSSSSSSLRVPVVKESRVPKEETDEDEEGHHAGGSDNNGDQSSLSSCGSASKRRASSPTPSTSRWRPQRQPQPPPAHLKKYLYPKSEIVEEMHPEDVRWMYRDASKKKWIPFIGYDSLRVEFKYRELSVTASHPEKQVEMIVVRGGLYEVDVISRQCYSLFWSGDTADVIRGVWFYEDTWQPLDEETAVHIESEHLAKFFGQNFQIDSTDPLNVKLTKPVHRVAFTDFHVEWKLPTEVYMLSDSTPSKIVRSVSQSLGFQKTGTKLSRGYCDEAKMDDKPPDITHLVFVVHGIGQKMDTGNIIRRSNELRDTVDRLKNKYFPKLDNTNQRVEFLPVEWRSNLQLDGDTVEHITPQKVKGLRTILNSSAMDILYYTSPLYRSEITHGLQSELNRIYSMFCVRNPYFHSSSGKVSIAAHSLGAVITYDIIISWNPIKLYDQFVASLIIEKLTKLEERREQIKGSSHLLSDLDNARVRVSEIESELTALQEQQKKGSQFLKFKVENLFCLGSPLAVFLALRGVPFHGRDSSGQPNLIPPERCKRLLNIYHPADPIAYRLEPLVYKHYASILPVEINRCDAALKRPYSECVRRVSAPESFPGSVSEQNIASSESELEPSAAEAETDSASLPKQAGFSFGNMFLTFIKKSPSETLSPELKELKKMETEAKKLEEMTPEPIPSSSLANAPKLSNRMDFQLKESSFESSYLSVLTSHTAYWSNQDVAFFILSHIYPELQES